MSELNMVTDLILNEEKGKQLINWLLEYYNEQDDPYIRKEITDIINNAIDGYFVQRVENNTLDYNEIDNNNLIESYKKITNY